MTKMEKLLEVKTSLASVLNKLEVYIFTEDVDNILDDNVKPVISEAVEKLKQ